ncbi:MAG: hypothetical protein ACYCPR_12285 [Thermoplasmataceae archaeon]
MAGAGIRSVVADLKVAIGARAFDPDSTPRNRRVLVLDEAMSIRRVALLATGSESAWTQIALENLGHRMRPGRIWTDVYWKPEQQLRAGWHVLVPATTPGRSTNEQQ